MSRHQMMDVPEFDYMGVQENVEDWRLGKRIEIHRPKLSLGLGCGLMTLAPSLLILAVGGAYAFFSGDGHAFASVIVMAVLVEGVVALVFLVPFHRDGGDRRTVIDWETDGYLYRYRWWKRRFPLSSVQLLRVRTESNDSNQSSRETAAVLEARIQGGSYVLLRTRTDKKPMIDQCAKLGRVGQRLAEALSVPCEFLAGQEPLEAAQVLRRSRTLTEVARNYVALAGHMSGLMMLAEHKGQPDAAREHRDEAIFFYMQANALDPSLSAPLLEIGRLSGNRALQVEAATMARDQAPDDLDALREQAWLAFLDDDYERAVDLYTTVIESAPSVKAYHGRADVYQELDRYQQAVADYTSAIECDPEDVLCYSKRADCLSSWYEESPNPTRLQQALDDYAAATRLAPDNDTFPTARCRLLAKAGRTAEALAGLDELIQRDPRAFYPLTERGQIHLKSGRDPNAALRDFDAALEIMESEPQSANASLRSAQNFALASALEYRSEALRELGRNAEADRDEQRADSIWASIRQESRP